MRLHRLFVSNLSPEPATFSLDKQASHYLLQVLRCRTGQELQLFDGKGLQCHTILQDIVQKTAVVSTEHCEVVSRESPLDISLALGISKGERMDTAIQKAVELGVRSIQPLQTEHSVVNLNKERASKRHLHWQGIITNACEQCGRNTLPELNPLQTLQDWLEQERHGTAWIFSPQSEQTLSSQLRPDNGVIVLIGPEGGFSDKEIKLAVQHGVTEINFGPRILRTETAAIASISAIQALWGDLG